MEYKLDSYKVGLSVRCTLCGHYKKPRGRSEPIGAMYCTGWSYFDPHGCTGYYLVPYVGSLWPGESEVDFGYPVSNEGTTKEVRDNV